jgi:hypothetical protein
MLEELGEDGNNPHLYSNSSLATSMNSSHGHTFPQTPDALNNMPVGDNGYSWGYWPGYWNQMQSSYNNYYYDPLQEQFMYPGSVPLTALHEGGEELYTEGSGELDLAKSGSPRDDVPPMLPLARRPSPVLEEPHVDSSEDTQPAKPKLVIRNTFIEIKDDANNSHVPTRKVRSETNQQRKRELAELREAFANS